MNRYMNYSGRYLPLETTDNDTISIIPEYSEPDPPRITPFWSCQLYTWQLIFIWLYANSDWRSWCFSQVAEHASSRDTKLKTSILNLFSLLLTVALFSTSILISPSIILNRRAGIKGVKNFPFTAVAVVSMFYYLEQDAELQHLYTPSISLFSIAYKNSRHMSLIWISLQTVFRCPGRLHTQSYRFIKFFQHHLSPQLYYRCGISQTYTQWC